MPPRMVAPPLRPAELEIRLMGTMSRDQLTSLSDLVMRKLSAGEARGPWTAVHRSDDLDPHHTDLGGYKLVTPLEIGTVTLLPPADESASAVSVTIQVYSALVPCYQVWLRLPQPRTPSESRQITWSEIRAAYQYALREVTGLGLDPRIMVWSVTVDSFPWEIEEPTGPDLAGGTVSARFFDLVLGEEGSRFRAASWYGTAFVGLHITEGKEHFLVVDGDSSRPFRVSQFFYLLIGRTQMHIVAHDIHLFSRSLEADREIGIETLPVSNEAQKGGVPPRPIAADRHASGPITTRLKVWELDREIRKVQTRRGRMAEASITLSRHLAHADMIRDFVSYHSSGLTSDATERPVTCGPPLPKLGAELSYDLRIRYQGPLNEAVQWARELIRRAAENNESKEAFMRDRMTLLMTRNLWRLQLTFLALTLLALGLSLYGLFR